MNAQLPLVLLVDDEPAVLRSIERLLREEPCEVVATEDPREALALAERRPVDVVLTDHRMPAMSGGRLLELLGERSPSTAPILVTAYPDAPDLSEAARRRVRRLVTKPWNDEDLLRAVRSCLAARTADEFPKVACAGRARREILSEVARALDSGRSAGRAPRVLLEDPTRVCDSISRLLSELAELALLRSARVLVEDPSGLTEVFLRSVPSAGPYLSVRIARGRG